MRATGIKNVNVQYLTALQDTIRAYTNINKCQNPIKMHLVNLLTVLSEICSQFAKNSSYTSSINMFIIDYYANKYQKQSQLQRHFYGFLESWRKNLDHGDCKVYLSLLKQDRNDRANVKLFLKIRKAILKNTCSNKVLQNIEITHEDSVTLAHSLFDLNTKNFIIKKINQFFINLKRKFINTAKVDGAVLTQFFINCLQQKKKIDINQNCQLKLNEARIKNNNINNSNKYVSPPKQNLSFSQEYAQYYSKENQQQQNINEQANWFRQQNKKQLKTSKLNENQYNTDSIQNQWDGYQQKIGFTFDKLHQLDKYSRKYPEGWQDFLKKHQIVKKKLLTKPNIQIDIQAANQIGQY